MDFAGFKVYVYVCLTNSLIENWLYLHVHIQLLLLIWLSISLIKTIIPYVCLVSIILFGRWCVFSGRDTLAYFHCIS